MEDVTSAQTTDTATTQTADTVTTTQTGEGQATQQEKYVPFASGKEKFKVNDQERELTWEEAKRYAQLGFSATEKFQKAAQLDKKARETFMQLVQAAKDDSMWMMARRQFNPEFNPQGQFSQGQAEAAQTQDPLNPIVEELNRVKAQLEQQEVEKERQAIEKEISDAVAKFPNLKSKWMQKYVRDEYRSLLLNGVTEYSIEDVAFQVNQEFEQERQAQQKSRIETLEKNKERAPVTTTPARGGNQSRAMTREEIRKLAGRPI